MPVHNPAQPATAVAILDQQYPEVRDAAPRADEPATLKLGAICERLGFTMTSAFVADTLDIQPAKADRASKLYTERQYALICRQLVAHISAAAELHTADAA